MNGKVIVTVEEINECASSIEVDVDLYNGSPEEACNLCYSVADSLNAIKFPEVAGVLALSILTNKPAYMLADELGVKNLQILGEVLHKETNELVQERIVSNRTKKHKETLRERLDKLFSK